MKLQIKDGVRLMSVDPDEITNEYETWVESKRYGQTYLNCHKLTANGDLPKSLLEKHAIEGAFEVVKITHKLIKGEYAPEPEPKPDPLAGARALLVESEVTVEACRNVLESLDPSSSSARLIVALADILNPIASSPED